MTNTAPPNVASDAIGTVDLQLGDRVRRIKFGWKALETLERVLGRGFLNGDERAPTFNGFTEIRVFLWAGLLHESPDMKLSDLDPWMDTQRTGEFSDAITKAMFSAFPEKLHPKADSSPPRPGVQ